MPVARLSVSICSATSSGEPIKKRSRISSSKLDTQIVIAHGHRPALSPLIVRAVLRGQERAAEPDRFAARLRHEHFAACRELPWERLAVLVERLPVEVDLAHDRVDPVVRVDVPAVAEPRRATDRRVGVGADPDRRVGLLHGLDRRGGPGQREVRADHVHRVLGPQPLDRFQVLLEALHPLLLRRAEGEELDVAIAEGGAEDDLAAAQDVGGGDLLGDVQRLVEREQHEPEVDAHVRGLGHDPAEERHLLQALPRRAAVVHAVGDRRVAERVGQSRLLRELAEARLHVVPGRELGAHHQAELHRGRHRAWRVHRMVMQRSTIRIAGVPTRRRTLLCGRSARAGSRRRKLRPRG